MSRATTASGPEQKISYSFPRVGGPSWCRSRLLEGGAVQTPSRALLHPQIEGPFHWRRDSFPFQIARVRSSNAAATVSPGRGVDGEFVAASQEVLHERRGLRS